MINKITTALEITPTHIKMAQSQYKSGVRVVNKLMVREIPSNAPEETAGALKDLVSAARVKSADVKLVVPRQFITLRVIKLPSQDEKEISKMVELQLSKQIPWPMEEITADYLIVEKDSLGYSKVLVVVCQKEVIKRYLKIVAESSLKVRRIALSSEGVCLWFRNFSQKNNLRDLSPVVLLDIDTKNIDICFYHREKLIFTRSVAFLAADLNSAKLDSLVEEFRKTFATLQRDQVVSEIGKIYIASAAPESGLLADKLRQEFPCAIELVNPLREISFEKGLIVPPVLHQGNCSGSAILGLVLGAEQEGINLLPAEVKEEEKKKNKAKDLVFLGVILFLLLVISCGAFVFKIYKKELYLKKLDATLKADNPKAKEVESALKKLTLIRERLNPRSSSIDVIYELYNLIPEGVSLSIFSFDEAELITLQGVAVNMSDVFNFQGILEKSLHFKNVEVKYASKRKVRGSEVTDFRITCAVENEKVKKL